MSALEQPGCSNNHLPKLRDLHEVDSKSSTMVLPMKARRVTRVSACRRFRFIIGSMAALCVLYIIGVVTMAINVHQLDLGVSLNETGSDHLSLHKVAKQTGGETVTIRHHKPAKVLDKAQTTTGGVAIKNTLAKQEDAPKPKNAVKKATGGKVKGDQKNKGPKGSSSSSKSAAKPVKLKRPGFKAKPYGHMVDPDAIFNTTGDKANIKGGGSNRVIPRDQQLAAYLEPIDKSNWETKPLPIRATIAQDLEKRTYPQLNSCSRLPEQWPVDEYADEDPFLPWIHDVFPTEDGNFLQFVAQNKLRCHTGYAQSEEEILEQMGPQVSLFQHVPLKKLNISTSTSPRYRLSSHDDADPDSIDTRFICKFKPSGDITFSEYNNDYEWIATRKRQRKMFARDGRNNHQIHTSQLLFRCPIPEHLVESVKSGTHVQDDWATVFVDLIPVRTPPRYGRPDEFLVPKYFDSFSKGEERDFDADEEWGKNHVLPALEDSGRWENIPICRTSFTEYEPEMVAVETKGVEPTERRHRLVSCLWASSGYTTRGNRFAVNDGQRRLMEWITFNKILGFDHFYIYDNSGAFPNTPNLQAFADMFPDDVTIIRWPSRVCNNNPNNVDSPGERSSQYAAESSCRLRFGHRADWIGQFDIDEYLVPMGEYNSLLPLLDKLDQEGTKAISFASWRAWPRWKHINEPVSISDKELCGHPAPCFELSIKKNVTFLEGYNCDRQKPGKKEKQMPAEKQIYRPDYVTQHFIHYSTVTKSMNLNYEDFKARFGHRSVVPDPLTRFGDEINEGLMLHSKAIARQDTAGWVRNCHSNHTGKGFDQCRLGFPWPDGEDSDNFTRPHDSGGWNYNCYVNKKIDNYWAPELQSKLQERGFL